MSSILKDALKAVNGQEAIAKLSGHDQLWPETYGDCAKKMHAIDEMDTHNSIEHKLISWTWNVLMYKTWLYHKKTYIVDVDFFMSLTKAKSVRIYPSVLKTLPFKT